MDQINFSVWAFCLSVVSFFVSCASCIVAIQQLSANRRHQRLSVTPCFTTDKDFEFNKETHQVTLVISLENKGLGPAIVDKIGLTVDQTDIVAGINDIWEEALKSLRTFKGEGFSYQYLSTIVAPNHCILPKDRIELLRVTVANKDREGIEDFANKCRISIKYHTFYLDKYEYTTDLHQSSGVIHSS